MLVPAAACKPAFTRSFLGGRGNASKRLGKRACAGQVHFAPQPCAFAQVEVGIVEAGHGEVSIEVDALCIGTCQLQICSGSDDEAVPH